MPKGQDAHLGYENYDEPKRVPRYLLVFRWAHCSTGKWTWQYVSKTFDSLTDAFEALNPASANEITEHDFIGLWELRDDALLPLNSERTEKVVRSVIERRTEKTRWTVTVEADHA